MKKLIKIICFTLLALSGAAQAMDADKAQLGEQLICATREGNCAKMKELLDAGADVNYADSFGGVTALMRAVHCDNQLECVSLLIKSGADVNLPNASGETALLEAAFCCHKDCMRLLIEAGADVNYVNKDGGQVALTNVFRSRIPNKDALDCAQLLLDAGVDLNCKNILGRRALHCVVLNTGNQPYDTRLTLCKLIVEKMLRTPHEKMCQLLGIWKKQKNYCMQYSNLGNVFRQVFPAMVQENRKRVREAIDEVSNQMIKQDLLNHFFPKPTPANGATN